MRHQRVGWGNAHLTTCTGYYNDFGLAQSRLWNPGTLCITIAANIAETGFLAFVDRLMNLCDELEANIEQRTAKQTSLLNAVITHSLR
ncbi:hypothetical protein [Roseofilum capinflatum]|uniref:Uncharacterized protein n=1 Tax=Roseofilum capinflatum BLCC-M114 TaxID=3022440 RepID=A0ABT7BC06_9CYAN|nr:hypothetical protein [Roseofilum capinflatum]MDJ1176687.1 hypothetical protein [Roseofilum capinflatum BLCC-M114]